MRPVQVALTVCRQGWMDCCSAASHLRVKRHRIHHATRNAREARAIRVVAGTDDLSAAHKQRAMFDPHGRCFGLGGGL